MDENLLSRENSLDLYRLSLIVEKECNGKGVYTIYSWLREILWGDKEPSKNSMDMDYIDRMSIGVDVEYEKPVVKEKSHLKLYIAIAAVVVVVLIAALALYFFLPMPMPR